MVNRVLLILLLSTLAYTAVPASAQPRTQDRIRTMEEVRETERQGELSARQWAMNHRVPRRIVQDNGSLIELVAVYDGRPFYYVPVNIRSAQITGTSALHPGGSLGLNLAGAGLTIGLWDAGHVRSDHVELAGRVTFGDEDETSSHATHVGGTLAASGVNPEARGMAPAAALRSYNWTNDATEMGNEASAGLVVSNHSYGVLAGWHYGDLEEDGDRWYWLGDPDVSRTEDYIFGRYDVQAVQFDRIAGSHPYLLPVVAVGNDRVDTGPSTGPYRAYDSNGDYQTFRVDQRPIPRDGGPNGFDTIAGAGTAKNVLTVGSVGYSSIVQSAVTSSFSSFGPTDDGRIKPDLAGVGEAVYSTSSSGSSAYGRSSGTSMSTPNVTGSLLLLQEYHRNLFGTFMRAASLKGLAIHTASDLEQPGPDYRTGWGLLDAREAARHLTSAIRNSAALVEAFLQEGGEYVREVAVESAGDVKVTLSWTDPASVRLSVNGASALDNPHRHLRNDLDVRLVHLGTGASFYPYILDPVHPDRAPTTGDNVVDPVEQVYLPQADSGRYAVVVTHKGSLHGAPRQPFSLLVSGASAESSPVAIAHLEAESSVDGVTLTWQTLFEEQAGTFIVERAPAGSAKVHSGDYERVGELAISGEGARPYRFFDEVSVSGRYHYRISYRDGAHTHLAGTIDVSVPAPETYAILSSYPNPFEDAATVVVDLPTTQHVQLDVFDVVGRKVATVHEGPLPAGRHHLHVAGDDWASGVYLVRVLTPSGSTVHRMSKL